MTFAIEKTKEFAKIVDMGRMSLLLYVFVFLPFCRNLVVAGTNVKNDSMPFDDDLNLSIETLKPYIKAAHEHLPSTSPINNQATHLLNLNQTFHKQVNDSEMFDMKTFQSHYLSEISTAIGVFDTLIAEADTEKSFDIQILWRAVLAKPTLQQILVDINEQADKQRRLDEMRILQVEIAKLKRRLELDGEKKDLTNSIAFFEKKSKGCKNEIVKQEIAGHISLLKRKRTTISEAIASMDLPSQNLGPDIDSYEPYFKS